MSKYRSSKRAIEKYKIEARKERKKLEELTRDLTFLFAAYLIKENIQNEYEKQKSLATKELQTLGKSLDRIVLKGKNKNTFLMDFSRHVSKYGVSDESDKLKNRYIEEILVFDIKKRAKIQRRESKYF
mgnify:CR=1 FL=1